jgi:protein-S-isoprenylcysteine O-methyltransferase Ste14
MAHDHLSANVATKMWQRGEQAASVSPGTVIRAAMNGSRLRLRLTRLMAVFVIAIYCFGRSYWSVKHPVAAESLFLVGVALASFGAVGRAWAVCYISGLKMKQLVKTGPYSLCRNPLYFFSTILAVGFGFCTRTISAPIFVLIVLGVLYYFQIRHEEQRLTTQFDAEFRSYFQSIPRFFPSFRRYVEPDEICISPKRLKNGLFGIAFLLILIGVLELIRGLHQSGILPELYRIF